MLCIFLAVYRKLDKCCRRKMLTTRCNVHSFQHARHELRERE